MTRYLLSRITCAALLLAVACELAAQEPRDGKGVVLVSLKPSTVVTSAVVRLGDLAAIRGGSESLREKVANLDVLDLAVNGSQSVVPREQVSIRLRLAGLDLPDFKMVGAAQTTVRLDPAAAKTIAETPEKTPEAVPVLVKTRDAVRLIARIGAIRVSAMGEALQEGRAGQVIRVRNVDSNKVVSGRVVERNLVEVEY